MAENPERQDEEEDLLRRAEALLGRHRPAASAAPQPDDIPTLTEAVDPADAPSLPTLAELVPVAAAQAEDASSGEIISRVQVQNLEHSVYQKLRRDLDERIADVLQSRFMPD